MIVLYIILAVLVLLLAVVLLCTAAFHPKAEAFRTYAPVEFDREAAVTNLQQLIRCRTVSYTDAAKEDPAEFEKLIALLPELYPHVYEKCTLTRLPDRGLLFYWAGKAHDEASVMMAHFDVVPVEEENWKKPPFEGIIEDGVLWGRGTLDTKVTFNGVLTAADHLIAQGFQPEQDIYFAFSGQEEINGPGAVNIVHWFQEHNINIQLVVDEGGAVVEDVFPGVKQPCALIGIAEKGMMNLEYSVSSAGVTPPRPSPTPPWEYWRMPAARWKITPSPCTSLPRPPRCLIPSAATPPSFTA